MRFFNFDNPIFQGINKLVDCVFLSFLWVIFSIPLITIGASTSAAYYTANKVLRHDRGYVFQQFWASFKSSFKQALVTWLLFVILITLMLMDIRLLGLFFPSGMMLVIARSIFLLLILVILMTAQYVFPYIARFELSVKNIITNSLFIAFRHLPWTILLLLILAICLLLAYIIPLMIFVVPCIWAIFASLIIERIFKKYMSEEDKEKEERLNSKHIGD